MYKILIVDETPQILYAAISGISVKDYAVYFASTGAAAMLKLSRICPDLAVISSELEDMSGFDLCKTIKADEEFKNTLVLMIVEGKNPAEESKAVYAGCDDYMARELLGRLLFTKLRSMFRIKELNASLRERYAELESTNKNLEMQLKMAMKVQRSIFHDIDMRFNNLKIMAKYLPALAVGGDFFNVNRLDNHRLGIILGDVSGHGLSSSLLTLMLSQIFVSVCRDIIRPSSLLKIMNEDFYSIFENTDSDMYACVFYAIIDTHKNTITYSNSGQAYPVLVKARGADCKELELDGIPVGMLKNVEYTDVTVNYEAGDLLFLHTDGLSDVSYKEDNDLFKRLLKEYLMGCSHKTEKLNAILDGTIKKFYTDAEKDKYKTDDISAIAVQM